MHFDFSIKEFIRKYSYVAVLLYFFIYMAWFNYLEKNVTADSTYNVMYSRFDSMIPFCEYFVIPYVLWFAYVATAIIYFLFISKKDFLRLVAFLFIGMTICLIIYTIYPNGQALRPTEFARDNVFVDMCKTFYKNDTPTNVCPSIHCLNSIGVSIAIFTCKQLQGKRFIKVSSTLLSLSIIASTMFIKQHSIIDVVCAILLSTILFIIIYVPDYEKVRAELKSFALKRSATTYIKQ